MPNKKPRCVEHALLAAAWSCACRPSYSGVTCDECVDDPLWTDKYLGDPCKTYSKGNLSHSGCLTGTLPSQTCLRNALRMYGVVRESVLATPQIHLHLVSRPALHAPWPAKRCVASTTTSAFLSPASMVARVLRATPI